MFHDFFRKKNRSREEINSNNQTAEYTTNLSIPKAEKISISIDELRSMSANALRVLTNDTEDADLIDDENSPQISDKAKLYRQFLTKTRCTGAFRICLNEKPIEEWQAYVPAEYTEGVHTLITLLDYGEALWDESQSSLIVPDVVIAGIDPRIWPMMGLPPLA